MINFNTQQKSPKIRDYSFSNELEFNISTINSKFVKLIICVILMLVVSLGEVKGAIITVSTNTNWSALIGGSGTGGSPNSTDAIIINSTNNTVILTVDVSNALCSSIAFTSLGNLGTLNVTSGQTLNVSGAVTLNNADVDVSANISGNGTLVCGSVNVGNTTPSKDVTPTHTLTCQINTFQINGNLTINSYTANGQNHSNGTFSQTGGTITINGSIVTTNQGSSTCTYTLGSSSTLLLGGATPFSLTGTGNNTITLTGTGSTVNYDGGVAQTVYGTTYNNLTLSGSNTKTLTVTSPTINGTLTVKGGTIFNLSTFGATTSSISVVLENGSTASTISGSGQLTLGGDVTVNYIGGSGNGALISCPVALGTATRNFTVADETTAVTDLTISGIISGGTGGSVTKNGLGTLLLSGLNTYPGATSITAGTLKLGISSALTAGGPLGTGAGGTTVSSGAVLDANGYSLTGTYTEAITLNGTGLAALPAGALTNTSSTASSIICPITLGSASTVTTSGTTGTLTCSGTVGTGAFALTLDGVTGSSGIMSGIISTPTSVIKNGGGTWTLSGTNTYTGATMVNGGTLKAGAGTQAFGLTSAVTLANTAGVVLDITGFANTIGSLTGGGNSGGNVTLGASTLTIGSDNTSPASYAGVISGTGAITKSGTGALTFSGANTYAGATNITTGTLKLGVSSTIATAGPLGTTASGTIVSLGAVLDLNGYSMTLADNEAITLNGTGLAALPAGALTNKTSTASSIICPIILGSAATITTASTTGTLTCSGTVTGAFALTLDGAIGSSGTMSGIISTPTSVIKNGSGTWTLSGTNTFTGGLTINAGIIQLGLASCLKSTLPVILNGGTLGTGVTAGFTNTVGTLTLTDNSKIALGTGSHTLTFANSSSLNWTIGKTVTITGWTGSYNGTSGTSGKIYIGTSTTGLTTAQLAQIQFFDGTNNFPVILLSTGEVVPTQTTSPSNYFQSVSNGNWSLPGNWQSSPDGLTWSIATMSPTNAAARITIQSPNTITVDGSLTANNLVIASGGTLSGSTNNLSVTGYWTNNGGSFTPLTGTVTFMGAALINGTATTQTFNNLIVNMTSGTLSVGGSTTILVVGGNFTETLGSFTAPATMNVSGNWNISGGIFTHNNGTVTFNGTSAQTINSGGSPFNNLNITNTIGTCTALTNAITIAGTLTTNANTTLDMGTNALGVTTVNNSGTIKTQNTSNTPLPSGLTWGGMVNYNTATGGQSIMAGTYNTLTLGNTSGSQTAAGNITAFTLNNNTNASDVLDMATNTLGVTTVNNTGTIKTKNTSAQPLPSGQNWGGTVDYNSGTGGQTIMGGTYSNLTLGNNSGTQTAAGDISTTSLNNTNSSDILDMTTFMLKGITTTVTNLGIIKTQNISPTPFPTNVNWGVAGTINYNASTGGQSIMGGYYNFLSFDNTSGTQTAVGNITVNTLNNKNVFDMSTFALVVTTVKNTGIINTQNITSTPLSTGITWGGTVNYNALTGGQSVVNGIYSNLTLSNTSHTDYAIGLLTVNGNLTTTSGGTLDMQTNPLIGTLGIVTNGGTINTQNGSTTPLPASRNWGGTVNYYAAAGQTVITGIYNNLTLSGSGAKTITGTTVNGILSMEGTATSTGTTTYGTASSIQYKGTAAQTTGTEFPTTFTTTGGVIINNTFGVILNEAKTINASVTIQNGKLTLGTFTSSAYRLFFGQTEQSHGSWGSTSSSATFRNDTYFGPTSGILNVSATSCIAGTWTGATSTDWNTASNWCDGNVPTAATSVFINSGGNQPIIGANASCNNITINSGASLTINGSYTLAVSGVWSNSGSFIANSGTVDYHGTAQTIGAEAYYHLTLSGSGAMTLQPGTTIGGNLTLTGTATTATVAGLTIGGNLTIGDGTTFITAGYPFTVTGTTTVGGGSSGSLVINSATGTKLFAGAVIIANGASWNNTSNSPVEYRGSITSTPIFTAGTGIQSFTTNAQALNGTFNIPNLSVTGVTLTNKNTLTVSSSLIGTGGLTQGASATLSIGGTSGITTLTATNSNNTVYYTGTGQTISPTTYVNLTLSNTSGTQTTGGNIVTTTLYNISGGTLDMIGYSLSGTINNTGSTIRFNGASNGLAIGTGTVEYYGTTQTVANGNYGILNITATGTKTAGGNITATTLDNGGASNVAVILDMAGNTLTTTTIDNTGATIKFSGTNNGQAIPTGTVEYTAPTGSQIVAAGTYNILTLDNISGLNTTGGNIIASTLNTTSGGTLNMGTNSLTVTTPNNNGIIRTQNTSLVPLSSGLTWGGTVTYDATLGSQTAVAGSFNNLSIANPAGVYLAPGSTINVNTLLINSGKLEIGTGTAMNVQSSITNSVGASGLVIKAGSNVPNGTLIFSGTPPFATVEMYSKACWNLNNGIGDKYQWQYFGIPVQPVTASPTFDGAYVRAWNEAEPDVTKHWVQQTNGSVLSPFTGYEICQSGATTYQIRGQLVNSDFTTYATTVLPYDAGAAYPGQHIFANPYTAAIDINKLTFGIGTEATVYLYNTGTYNQWQTQNGSTQGSSPGQYTSVPQNLAGGISTPTIPSMQGFLVKAMADINGNASPGAFFSMTYASVTTPNTSPQRAPAALKTDSSKYLSTRIDVTGANSADRLWIFTEPACTHHFDNGWDGHKLMGSSLTPQLYALETDGIYQVDAVDDMNNTDLGFQAGQDVNYTLTFTHTNIESRYAGVYLMDKVENKTIDITESGSAYSFVAASTSQTVNRFTIITRPLDQNASETDSQLKIFGTKGTVLVQNFSSLNGEVMIYDLAGHCLKTATLAPYGGLTTVTGFMPGVYIAKAITSKEGETKRLIVQ